MVVTSFGRCIQIARAGGCPKLPWLFEPALSLATRRLHGTGTDGPATPDGLALNSAGIHQVDPARQGSRQHAALDQISIPIPDPVRRLKTLHDGAASMMMIDSGFYPRRRTPFVALVTPHASQRQTVTFVFF